VRRLRRTYNEPCSAPAMRSKPGQPRRTTFERPCCAVRPTCWPSTKLSWRTGSCGRRGSAALFRQRVGRRGGVPSGRRARQRSIGSGSAVGAAAVVFYPPQALDVVGVIAPFNAPLILAARALAPALAVGNAVVLKPDPRTAVCGGVAFARLLEEAGLPTMSSTSFPVAATSDENSSPTPMFPSSPSPGR
jgi:Aldehyde dehydrogenase family